jgi:YHS domain-containing protein/uncharacterized membrane protein YraQ (UPF0718 family)
MELVGATPAVLHGIGRVLAEAGSMLWETLWALVLGFTLSGIVQAFVSRATMQRKLGNHGALATMRATLYGMASSSCSYAASAMAKSLFLRGADFIAAMVFMIASTNLVIELGLVLLVLLGWQFVAAEFIGGPIMILLLVISGGLVFTRAAVAAARAKLQATSEAHGHETASSDEHVSIRSLAAWSNAARYAVADATMLRRELVIGYLVAGLLAMEVPTSVWNHLFLHGHGVLTTIENAFIGPLIAILSWVCSVGNVPLAAALWSGGISFGGVVAFVFADLIAMPLLLVYAKFYGWKMTLRILAAFYAVMVVAGLVTHGLFAALHLIPENTMVNMTPSRPGWNLTTALNLSALVLFALVFFLARNAKRFGGGAGYAIDPVCGMQVREREAPAQSSHEGVTYYFCADRCRTRFDADPTRFTAEGAVHEAMETAGEPILLGRKPLQVATATTVIDPICAMTVSLETAAATRERAGVTYGFCSLGCAAKFDEDNEAGEHGNH